MAGANLHLEHLEDIIINDGVEGAKNAFGFLDHLTKAFSSKGAKSFKVTTKWDGAPAIFCGYLPGSKDWFVAKKSLFNTTPKLYHTKADIEKDFPPGNDLHKIFILILKHIKPLHESGKIQGIVQGDFLFHNTSRTLKKIDGNDCVVFKPNVSGITYCIPKGDTLYDHAKNAELCVVFHTRYNTSNAKSLEDLGAEYAYDATQLSTQKCLILSSKTSELGSDVMLTPSEVAKLKRYKSAGETLFRQCGPFLDVMSDSMKDAFGIGPLMKIYINTYVRDASRITSATKFYQGYLKFVEEKYRKKIDGYAKDATKSKWKKNMYASLDVAESNKAKLLKFIALYNTIQNAKAIFIPKLEKGERFKQYYEDGKGGYDVGAPEGYVAVREGTNAVKLIDRLVFSAKNFQR